MAEYLVAVQFHEDGGKYYVTAEPYPVPKAGFLKKGDSVKWTATDFDQSTNVKLQVAFDVAYNRNDPKDIRRVSPMGPFKNLQENMNVVVGERTDDPDNPDVKWRYLCLFFRNGQWTPWKLDFVGANDGGVDTHRPPPMPIQVSEEDPAGRS